MLPSEFDEFNLRQFLNAADGYNEKERAHWERTRLICFYAVLPYQKNKSFKPADLWEIEGDVKYYKVAKARKLTEDEILKWHKGEL